ncbi:MAG: aminotransferase class I/II-fold pyridoxal phosphate-dependent enzyme [Candidatus Nitrosocosmicus sp.]
MVLSQNNLLFFKEVLEKLKQDNLYRSLRAFDVDKDHSLIFNNNPVINFSSNDYLGLSTNKKTISNINKITEFQTSPCSSRLISGTTSKVKNLETNLSLHRQTQSSLIFPTGYMANLGVLGAIVDKDTIIFSDRLNHASIIDGCRLSNGQIKIFDHNDYFKLEEMVKKKEDNNNLKKKVIVTEGLFSMDGDFSCLKEIAKISKENDCILIVDDAHGDFIIGDKDKKNFSGIPSYFDVNSDVDIHISSLSKGLGCFGGYISSSNLICEYIINKSRPFIFTSALPDFLCDIANTSLNIVKEGKLQKKLYENIDLFYKVLQEYDFNSPQKQNKYSPIIPIIIGSEKKAVEISSRLLKRGFFIQAIRHPTVEKNKARLRVSISALHTQKQIISLIETLNEILKSSQ